MCIRDRVEDGEVSPKLYDKFAATDTQANEQKLVIEGFENTGDLNGTGLNENLDVPVLSEDVEAKTPTSITLTSVSYTHLAVITFEDDTTKELSFAEEAAAYEFVVDSEKNVKNVDITFESATGNASYSDPSENRMLTLGEIDFLYTESVPDVYKRQLQAMSSQESMRRRL